MNHQVQKILNSKHLINKARFILLVLILTITLPLLAQGPPDPPVDPSAGGGPVGGPAPIGSGIGILLLMGAAYGGRKLFCAWQKIDE